MDGPAAQDALWEAVADIEETLPRMARFELNEAEFVAVTRDVYRQTRAGAPIEDLTGECAKVVEIGDAIAGQTQALASTKYLWPIYEALKG